MTAFFPHSPQKDECARLGMVRGSARVHECIVIFTLFLSPALFLCFKIRFKTEVCICTQFPTEAMQWIKEVELVDSVDESRFSSSTRGISMPNCEVLDARLDKVIHNVSMVQQGLPQRNLQ